MSRYGLLAVSPAHTSGEGILIPNCVKSVVAIGNDAVGLSIPTILLVPTRV